MNGGIKAQQPAISFSTPQLAGTLLCTAAAPEGNLLPDTESVDTKVSAAWDITATTSLNPQAAFATAAAAQQLVKLLSEQPGSRGSLPHTQRTSKEGKETGLASGILSPSMFKTGGAGLPPRNAGLSEEGDLLSQSLQNEAEGRSEVLSTPARADRPPGMDFFINPTLTLFKIFCLKEVSQKP